MAFDENKIKRDEDGKFATKDTPAEVKKTEEIIGSLKSGKVKNMLGEEFVGFIGTDAINKLIKEQKGHIKGAFTRTEIGDIDLVYGDESAGLAHIIKRRKEQGINIYRFLSEIPNIIANGEFSYDKSKKRYEIKYDGRIAIISPRMYDDDSVTWLLTAYEEY